MADRLAGKTALITGASRGIGEAMATAFCREGATVIISSRKMDALDAAAERIRARVPSADVRPRAAHCGKPEQIEELFTWLDGEGLFVDVLVNNAATNPYFGPMMAVDDFGAWDKTFDVNVKGPWLLTQAVCKRLLAANKPGSIVFTSSVAGQRAAPFQGIYGMTKTALISLTQTLAIELGAAGIRVNALAPGVVDTRLAAALTTSPEMTRFFTERSGLKRIGQPEEIAGAAVFLASDESSFMTGEVLNLDGGFLAG